jgi:AraC-like DNA-binding protein
MDQKFIQRVVHSIQKHLSDTDFTVEILCSEMTLSQRQVHRKLQGLTGYSISGFIRYMRLSRAAELLKNKTATVSEIAYNVGFDNLSYFSKCFKDRFGVSPSEFQ